MERLGDLINEVFRKSGLSAQEFADKISTTRENVYKILAKSSIDVGLLGRISEALNHDFFADISKNMDLVKETSEERERERAIMQFLDVVPKVMTELGRECSIHFFNPDSYDSILPFPEYFMTPYAISFTYGETYADMIPDKLAECPQMIKKITDREGHSVEIIDTLFYDTQCCNIMIDYKTKDEWRETMKFALNVINKYYTPGNKFTLERHNRQRIKW